MRSSATAVCLLVLTAAPLVACGSDGDSSSGSNSPGGAGSGGAAGGSGGAATGGTATGGTATGGTATGGSGGNGGSGVVGCGTQSSEAIRDCVDRQRLETDLAFVAQPRSPGTPHWQAVQDLCKARFEENGFVTELHDYGSGVNVIGVKTGSAAPTEQVVFSAHYDSVPNCAGADDNATGVVGVLEMSRLAGASQFERTLVLACWDEEESGLIGARAYAGRAKANGDDIRVMYSLEMIGYSSDEPGSQRLPGGFGLLFPTQAARLESEGSRGDFLAILPDTGAATFGADMARHGADVGLSTYKFEITDSLKNNPIAGDVQRSDHAAFWLQDYPAMLVTDTSEFRYDQYHCRSDEDAVANIVPEFLEKTVKASMGSALDALKLVP